MRRGKELIDSISKSEKEEIGEAAVDQMKNLISKGISPIEGRGRFPEYKWAGNRKDVISAVAAATRGDRSSGARKERSKSKKAYSNKYPFSAQKEFPDKRPRPVNLFLSGDFLSNLKVQVRNRIFIGFFDKLSSKKEEGHREGANGQPSRPIIPIDGERFSTTIVRKVELKIREILRRKNRT